MVINYFSLIIFYFYYFSFDLFHFLFITSSDNHSRQWDCIRRLAGIKRRDRISSTKDNYIIENEDILGSSYSIIWIRTRKDLVSLTSSISTIPYFPLNFYCFSFWLKHFLRSHLKQFFFQSFIQFFQYFPYNFIQFCSMYFLLLLLYL